MVPCYHCISIIEHISFIIPLYFTILKRTNYKTGQSPFCNLKILLVYILLLILHPVAFFVFSLLQLVLRPSPRRGTPKRDDRQRSAAQMPRARRRSTGWLLREKREEERKRETNLTCPKIVARYERARIQMDTDERATEAGTRRRH